MILSYAKIVNKIITHSVIELNIYKCGANISLVRGSGGRVDVKTPSLQGGGEGVFILY